MWRSQLEVNVLGICICTREVVKSMTKHGIDGHVFNINSIVGHKFIALPKPVLNVYPATKFGVTALTEGYRNELNHHGLKIKVTVIKIYYVFLFFCFFFF